MSSTKPLPGDKTWDTEEYTEKAKKRDTDEKERMQDNEQRMRQGPPSLWTSKVHINCSQGKRPRRAKREDLPKPTELMQRREGDLELAKNLNKTIVVQNASNRGPGQPGFHCETCDRTYRDSTGYLDHINSRARMYMPTCLSK